MTTTPAMQNQSIQSTTQSLPQSNKDNKKVLFIIIGVVVILSYALLRFFVLDKSGQKQNGLLRSDSSLETKDGESSLSGLLDESGQQQDFSDVGESSVSQENLPPVDQALVPPVSKDTILSISSNSQNYQVGAVLEATVLLSTSVLPDGVEMVIKYDPKQLTGVRVEPVSTFGSFLSNKVDANSGQIKTVFIRNPQDQPDISAALPLIKIVGTIGGTGSVTMNFDMEMTQVAAAGGQDVLQNTTGLTVTAN
jgi:hypothetical protein